MSIEHNIFIRTVAILNSKSKSTAGKRQSRLTLERHFKSMDAMASAQVILTNLWTSEEMCAGLRLY